ncbi:MAG: ABC transporter substrate-binding protein [Spirochaetaceae bacterium]|jgi:iron complex transport system substrate-binding protein|nr:ABC transporter substrate-binding protein [Spirochaetaceae bacterium]
MRSPKNLYLALCLLLLAAAAPAQGRDGFPLALTDALGRRVAVDAKPARVVSLSPAVTEILFAVGAGPQVAGVTEYCNYPPEAAAKAKVGGFSGITVNVEQIALLKSDLVILSGDMHQRIIELLDRLRIKSFAVEPRNFEEVYRTIGTIGRLTGNAPGAERVVAEMRAKLAQAGERRRGRGRPAVFWELSGDPLMSAGGNNFINEAITLAGGRNIFEDMAAQWPVVSQEQVMLRQPEWILAGDMAGRKIDPALYARRPGWSRIPAVRGGNVASVDPDTLYRYGPRLADAVLGISEIIFKD